MKKKPSPKAANYPKFNAGAMQQDHPSNNPAPDSSPAQQGTPNIQDLMAQLMQGQGNQ